MSFQPGDESSGILVRQVWRVEIPPFPKDDHFDADVPKGAVIIHFGINHNYRPTLYFLVNPHESITENRRFCVVGDGRDIKNGDAVHVGSCASSGMNVAYHLFELKGEQDDESKK
jgi:hypothetical protein